MSNIEKVSLQNFSIYLIKDNRKDYEDILRGLDFSDEMTITDRNTKIGHLFVKPTELGLPRWAKKFHGYIDESRVGKVATSSAVLLIKSESRYFAIAFGQGRYLLDPDCWEERFGLRVALNSIGEKQIKSIDKKTFDTITKHSREQASREVGAQDFGLDVEQDLLRAVTGTPTDPSLGQRLGGMDGLKVTVRAEIKDLPALVARYYEKYQDNAYKSNFPWVDHLMEVKDGNLVDLLDNLLIEIISRQEFNCCWLAAPEIMDWDQVDGFRYGLSQRSPICHDIHFPDFLESLHDNVEINKKVLMKKMCSALETIT